MALSLHQIVKHFNDVIAANQVGKPHSVMGSFLTANNLSPGEQAVYDKLRTAFLAESDDKDRPRYGNAGEVVGYWEKSPQQLKIDMDIPALVDELYEEFGIAKIANKYLISQKFADQIQSGEPNNKNAGELVGLSNIPGDPFAGTRDPKIDAKSILLDAYLVKKSADILGHQWADNYTSDYYDPRNGDGVSIIQQANANKTYVSGESNSTYPAGFGQVSSLHPTQMEINDIWGDVNGAKGDLTEYFSEYVTLMGEDRGNPRERMDFDNDGTINREDFRWQDPSESKDSDKDGVGDNADPFPNDPTEKADSDNDGVGNNADAFPFNPNETADSDNDGVGDKADVWPNDNSRHTDSDSDGVDDSLDAFPFDDSETKDSDGDGIGDNKAQQIADDAAQAAQAAQDTQDTQPPAGTDYVFSSDEYRASYALANDPTKTSLLDFDGDGFVDALTDGLLLMRYAFGVRGPMLTDDAVSPDATRTSEQISDFLDTVLDENGEYIKYLDFDSSGGKIDALTDGIVLMRYAFHLRGSNLATDTVNPNSPYVEAFNDSNSAIGAEIEKKLDALEKLAFESTYTGDGYDIDLDTAYNTKTGKETEFELGDYGAFEVGEDIEGEVEYETEAPELPDTDNDGVSDYDELLAGGDPYDENIKKWQDREGADLEYGSATDWDGDGESNAEDDEPLVMLDDDKDGIADIRDPFPQNPYGDSDGDNTPDNIDKFPFDPTEQSDIDDDGIGNNADEFPVYHNELDQNNNNIPDVEEDLDEDGILDLEQDVDPNNVRQLTEHYLSGDWDQDGILDDEDFDQFNSTIGEPPPAPTNDMLGSRDQFKGDFEGLIVALRDLSEGKTVTLPDGNRKITTNQYEAAKIGKDSPDYVPVESLLGFMSGWMTTDQPELTAQEKKIAAVYFPNEEFDDRGDLIAKYFYKNDEGEYEVTRLTSRTGGHTFGKDGVLSPFDDQALNEVFKKTYDDLLKSGGGLEAALQYAESVPGIDAPDPAMPRGVIGDIAYFRYMEDFPEKLEDLSDEQKDAILYEFRKYGYEDIAYRVLYTEDNALKDYYEDAFEDMYEEAIIMGNKFIRDNPDMVDLNESIDVAELEAKAKSDAHDAHHAAMQLRRIEQARLAKIKADENRKTDMISFIHKNFSDFSGVYYIDSYRNSMDAWGANDPVVKEFNAWRAKNLKGSSYSVATGKWTPHHANVDDRLPNRSEIDAWMRSKGWLTRKAGHGPGQSGADPRVESEQSKKIDAYIESENIFLASTKVSEREQIKGFITRWINMGMPEESEAALELFSWNMFDPGPGYGNPDDKAERDRLERYFYLRDQVLAGTLSPSDDRWLEISQEIDPIILEVASNREAAERLSEIDLLSNLGAAKRLGDLWRENQDEDAFFDAISSYKVDAFIELPSPLTGLEIENKYDGDRLYMKLPGDDDELTFSKYGDSVSPMAMNDPAVRNRFGGPSIPHGDGNNAGYFVDISGGSSEVGDYSMLWIELNEEPSWLEETLDKLGPIVDLVKVGLVIFGGPTGKKVALQLEVAEVALKVLDGQTLHGEDWASLALYGMVEFGEIVMPKSEADAIKAGKDAEAAARLRGITDAAELAQIANDAKALALSGVGIAGLNANQTIAMIRAAGTGDVRAAITPILEGFGDSWVRQTLSTAGVSDDLLNAITPEQFAVINDIATEMVQGASFEEAALGETLDWLGNTLKDSSTSVKGLFGKLGEELQNILRVAEEFIVNDDVKAIGEHIIGTVEKLPLKDIFAEVETNFDAFTDKISNAIDDADIVGTFDRVVVQPLDDIVSEISAPLVATGKIMKEALPDGVEAQVDKVMQDLESMSTSMYENLDDAVIEAAKQGVVQAVLENDGTMQAKAKIAQAFTRELIVVEELKKLDSIPLRHAIPPEVLAVGLRAGINAVLLEQPDADTKALKAMGAAAASAIRKSLDAGTFNQDFATYWDNVSGEFENAKQARMRLDTAQSQAELAAAQLKIKLDRKKELDAQITAAKNKANDPNASDTEIREAIAFLHDEDFQTEYQQLAIDIVELDNKFDAAADQAYQAAEDFGIARDKLSLTSQFDEEVAEFNGDITQLLAIELNPQMANVDEAKYREINGLSEDVNVYEHYVATGALNGVPVNAESYNARMNQAIGAAYNTVIRDAGIDDSQLTEEERAAIRGQLVNILATDAESVEGFLTPLQYVEGLQPGYFERIDADNLVLSGFNSVYEGANFQSIASINENLTQRDYQNFRDSSSNPLFYAKDMSSAEKDNYLRDLVNNELFLTLDDTGEYIWGKPPSELTFNYESGEFEFKPNQSGVNLSDLIETDPEQFIMILGDLPNKEAVAALGNLNLSQFEYANVQGTYDLPLDHLEPDFFDGDNDASDPYAVPDYKLPWPVKFARDWMAKRQKNIDEQQATIDRIEAIPENKRSLLDKSQLEAARNFLIDEQDSLLADATIFNAVADWTNSINAAYQTFGVEGQIREAKAAAETAKRKKAAELAGDDWLLENYTWALGRDVFRDLTPEQRAIVDAHGASVETELMSKIDYTVLTDNEYSKNMDMVMLAVNGFLPETYKDERDAMYKSWNEAEGAWEKSKVMLGSVENYPTALLHEIVIPELVNFGSEIFVGGSVGLLTKASAKQLGENIARQVGDPSVATSILLDVGEAAGGSMLQGYEETQYLLTQREIDRANQGLDPIFTQDQIQAIAYQSGAKAAATSILLMGVTSEQGFKLNKRILGDDAYEGLETLANRTLDFGTTIGLDTAAEIIEEVGVQGTLENTYYGLGFKDRDVSGNLTEAGLIAAFASGPTSVAGYGLSMVTDFTTPANINFGEVDDPLAAAMMTGNVEIKEAVDSGDPIKLKTLLLATGLSLTSDQPTYNSIMNVVDDAGYVTVLEAEKSFEYLGVTPTANDIAVAVDMQDGSSGVTLDEQLAAYWKANFGEETLGSGRTTAQTYDIIKHLEDMKDGTVPVDSTFIDTTTGESTITQDVIDDFKASLPQREQDLLDDYDTSKHVPTNIVEELGGSLMTQEEINKINEEINALKNRPDAPSASEVLEILLADESNAGIPNQVKNLVDAAFTNADNQAAFATSVVDLLVENETLKTLTEAEVAEALGSNEEGKETGIYLALKNLESDISSGDDDAATNLTTALGEAGTFDDEGNYNNDGTGVYGELSKLGVDEAAARKAIEDLVGKPAELGIEATGIFKTLSDLRARDTNIQNALDQVGGAFTTFAQEIDSTVAELSGVVGLPARPKLNEDGTEVVDANGKVVMLPPTGVYLAVQNAISAEGIVQGEVLAELQKYVASEDFETAVKEATNGRINQVVTEIGSPASINTNSFSKPVTEEARAAIRDAVLRAQVNLPSGIASEVIRSGNDPAEYFDLNGDGRLTSKDAEIAAGLPTSEDGASTNDLLIDISNGLQIFDKETIPATGLYAEISNAMTLEGAERDAKIAQLSTELTKKINDLSALPASEAEKIKKEIVDTYFPTAPELTAEDLAILPEVNYMLSLSGEDYFNSDDFKALPPEQQNRLKEYNTYLNGGSLGAQIKQLSLDSGYSIAGLENRISTLESNLINGIPIENITGLADILGDPIAGTGLYGALTNLGLDVSAIREYVGSPATEDEGATGLFLALENAVGQGNVDLTSDTTKEDLLRVIGQPSTEVTRTYDEYQDLFTAFVDQLFVGNLQPTPALDLNKDGVVNVEDMSSLLFKVRDDLGAEAYNNFERALRDGDIHALALAGDYSTSIVSQIAAGELDTQDIVSTPATGIYATIEETRGEFATDEEIAVLRDSFEELGERIGTGPGTGPRSLDDLVTLYAFTKHRMGDGEEGLDPNRISPQGAPYLFQKHFDFDGDGLVGQQSDVDALVSYVQENLSEEDFKAFTERTAKIDEDGVTYFGKTGDTNLPGYDQLIDFTNATTDPNFTSEANAEYYTNKFLHEGSLLTQPTGATGLVASVTSIENTIGLPSIKDDAGNVISPGFGLQGKLEDLGVSVEDMAAIIGSPAIGEDPATGLYGAIELASNTSAQALVDFLGTPAIGDDPATGLYSILESAISTGVDGLATTASVDQLKSVLGSSPTYNSDGTIKDEGEGLLKDVANNIYRSISNASSIKNAFEQIQGVKTDVTDLQTDVDTINTAIGTASSTDDGGNVVGGTGLIGQLEALGVEDAAIRQIIGSPATDEDTATGLYLAMETAASSSKADLLALIGSPATDEDTATGLYALIANTVNTGVNGLATEGSVTDLKTAIGTASSTDDGGNVVAGTGVIGQVEAVEGAVTTIEGDIGELQTDVGAIQTDLGTAQKDITDLQTDVGTKAAQTDLEAAEARLTAAEQNYATLKAGLGTTASQADLDAANEALLAAQSDVAIIKNQLLGIEGIGTDLEDIATILGKPSNLLTEDDIALATSYLGMAEDELAQANVLRYDVDAEEGFTQDDVDLMAYALQTGDYSGLREDSAFNVATGMFATQEANQAQIQQYQEDIIAREQQYQEDLKAQQELNQEMQQQMQMRLTQQFQQDLQDAENREKQEQLARAFSQEGKIEAKQAPLANIGYFVDMGSDNIFANEQQQGFYGSASPFGENFLPDILNPQQQRQSVNFRAKGGMIKDKTDEILRIIGEK